MFFLPFHASSFNNGIYLDIAIEKNWKLIETSELAEELGKKWCPVLLRLQVFTSEDCKSALKEKKIDTSQKTYEDTTLSSIIKVFQFRNCFTGLSIQ